jgi:hypothetical protein
MVPTVYAIVDFNEPCRLLVKIGRTRRPVTVRLRELRRRRLDPATLQLLATTTRWTERGRHQRHRAKQHGQSEWFKLDADLLADLAQWDRVEPDCFHAAVEAVIRGSHAEATKQ